MITTLRPFSVHRTLRSTFATIIGLAFAGLSVRADEQLPQLKVGNDVYHNVTVTSVTTTDIYFTSDEGMNIVKLENLDPEIQKHFHHTPAKTDKVVNTNQLSQIPSDIAIDQSNAQSIMDAAIARVKLIVNQPVKAYLYTPNMTDVRVASPGWFHPGAIKPPFNTVDVRTTQEKTYDQHAYYMSDLNKNAVYLRGTIEFNSMTKYFYTDRTVPKKKLTEPEMVEINRLYRIIGKCESKLRRAAAAQAP